MRKSSLKLIKKINKEIVFSVYFFCCLKQLHFSFWRPIRVRRAADLMYYPIYISGGRFVWGRCGVRRNSQCRRSIALNFVFTWLHTFIGIFVLVVFFPTIIDTALKLTDIEYGERPTLQLDYMCGRFACDKIMYGRQMIGRFPVTV